MRHTIITTAIVLSGYLLRAIILDSWEAISVLKQMVLNISMLLLLMFVVIMAFFKLRQEQYKKRNYFIGTSVYGILMLGLFLEAIFTFIPRSHDFGLARSTYVWFQYYRQRNSQGFRDEELSLKNLHKKIILFLGDSLTAGNGVAEVEDTYASLVGHRLQGRYEYLNLGKGDADSFEEYTILKNQKVNPQVVVFEYYPNDIHAAALRTGLIYPKFEFYGQHNWAAREIIKGSYFINYLYWDTLSIDITAYKKFIRQAFSSPQTLDLQFRPLQKIVAYCREKKATLIVLLFPYLNKGLYGEIDFTPIRKFFKDNKVEMVDIEELIKGLSPENMVANPIDGHPSAIIHRMVSDEIVKRIDKLSNH
jgi:hypothetical protein